MGKITQAKAPLDRVLCVRVIGSSESSIVVGRVVLLLAAGAALLDRRTWQRAAETRAREVARGACAPRNSKSGHQLIQNN